MEGIDYNETFAPVAKMVIVRTFLGIAISKNWKIHQMDVQNAFLHVDLEDELNIKLMSGFKYSNPGMVCHLRKSKYGSRQSPRCCSFKIVTALKEYGFMNLF